MISKVLIAEDHESANLSLQKTLKQLKIEDTDYAYYCDDALANIELEKSKNEPYDLLITDLYFEEDTKVQKLSGGIALIEAVQIVQPELKILVFTATQEPRTIDLLYNKLKIDGYVRKARNDAKELEQAINKIGQNQRYFTRALLDLIKNQYPFSDFQITILTLLIHGIRQKDIPEHLQKQNIPSKRLRSIETELNKMKTDLNCTTNEQLIAYCKDRQII